MYEGNYTLTSDYIGFVFDAFQFRAGGTVNLTVYSITSTDPSVTYSFMLFPESIYDLILDFCSEGVLTTYAEFAVSFRTASLTPSSVTVKEDGYYVPVLVGCLGSGEATLDLRFELVNPEGRHLSKEYFWMPVVSDVFLALWCVALVLWAADFVMIRRTALSKRRGMIKMHAVVIVHIVLFAVYFAIAVNYWNGLDKDGVSRTGRRVGLVVMDILSSVTWMLILYLVSVGWTVLDETSTRNMVFAGCIPAAYAVFTFLEVFVGAKFGILSAVFLIIVFVLVIRNFSATTRTLHKALAMFIKEKKQIIDRYNGKSANGKPLERPVIPTEENPAIVSTDEMDEIRRGRESYLWKLKTLRWLRFVIFASIIFVLIMTLIPLVARDAWLISLVWCIYDIAFVFVIMFVFHAQTDGRRSMYFEMKGGNDNVEMAS